MTGYFSRGTLAILETSALISQIFGPVFLTTGFHILAHQIKVDDLAASLPAKDSLDDRLRTGRYVTTGENTGDILSRK